MAKKNYEIVPCLMHGAPPPPPPPPGQTNKWQTAVCQLSLQSFVLRNVIFANHRFTAFTLENTFCFKFWNYNSPRFAFFVVHFYQELQQSYKEMLCKNPIFLPCY